MIVKRQCVLMNEAGAEAGGGGGAPEAPAQAPAEGAQPQDPGSSPADPSQSSSPGRDGEPGDSGADAGGADPTVDDESSLVEKLKARGYDVDGKRVTTKEHAAWREKKRRFREWAAAEESRIQQEKQSFAKESGDRLGRLERIDKLREAGDFDALAKELNAEDWNSLQDVVAQMHSNPGYREVQEIKRKLAEKERAEAEAQEQQKRQQEEQRRSNAVRQHLSSVSEQLKTSGDELAQVFADDPLFINTIWQVQQANFDPDGGGLVNPLQALDLQIPGQQQSLRRYMQNMYDKLAKALNKAAVDPSATDAQQPAKKPQKPNTIGKLPKNTPEASPVAEFKSDRDWVKHAAERLAQSEWPAVKDPAA